MQIYHQVTKYTEDGKPYLSWKKKEIRCDYTGRVINFEEDDHSYPSYNLDYGEEDPCFGSDGEEYQLGKDLGIDEMYGFLSQTYHFISNYYDDSDACVEMMTEFIEDGKSFASMCRYSRIRTARKLIESGEITPEQLISYGDRFAGED